MPSVDLDAIEQRLNAATPGPWCSTWEDAAHANDTAIIISSALELPEADRVVVGLTYYDQPLIGCRREDAALIAHARTDIAALIAEVRRLRAELAVFTPSFGKERPDEH